MSNPNSPSNTPENLNLQFDNGEPNIALDLNNLVIDQDDQDYEEYENNEANIIPNNGVRPLTPQAPIFNPAASRLSLTRIHPNPPFRPLSAVTQEPIWRNPNNLHNFQNLPNLEINNGVIPYLNPAVFPFRPPGIPPFPPFPPPFAVAEIPIWPNLYNPHNFQNLPILEINNGVRAYFNPADFHFPPPGIPPFPPFQPPADVAEIPIWWNPPNFQNLPNLEINNEVVNIPPNHQGFIFNPPINIFGLNPQFPLTAPNENDPRHRWLNLIDSSPENTPTYLLQSLGLTGLMKNLNALHLFKSILFRFHNYQPDLGGPNVAGLVNIAQTVTSDNHTFFDLATHPHGVHALIDLLRRCIYVNNIIYKAICNNFVKLMTANYGHCLIIATIRAVNPPKKKQICKLVYKNLIILATHEKGCIALRSLFREMKGTYRNLTVKTVKDNALGLAFHKYGTYVVQDILDLQEDVTSEGIARNLKGNFFELSVLKEESYVVQKCLINRSGREIVLEEFRSDKERLMEVAMDEFGSYVVVSALCEMKLSGMKEILEEFMEILRSGIEDLKIGHGKNVAKFIEIFGNGDEIDERKGFWCLNRLKKRRH